MRKCSIDGCEKPSRAGGYCAAHYNRIRRHGSPQLVKDCAPGINRRRDWIIANQNFTGDECLFWPFATPNAGRGMVSVVKDGARRDVIAAAFMLEVTAGPRPSPDFDCAHSCGNGHLNCVNPKHLRWATHKENGEDMVRHGRAGGNADKPSRLIPDEEIRAIRASNEPMREIGRQHGISLGLVHAIVHRKRYGEVA